MNSALKWLPLAMLVALAGCARDGGYYHDRNIDYADARQAAPLALPKSRAAERYRDVMPIPEIAGDFRGSTEGFEAPAPQPLGMGRIQREFVESRRVGDDAWLVVGAAPDSVWPQLESFARSRGLGVVTSDSSRGVVETRQGRLSVRQGLRAGDSEVRCDQAGRSVEACLDALEQYFSARSATASSTASLQAQRLAGGERLRLVQRGDEWMVDVPLDIDRTWAELNHQLEQDFTVEDRRELLNSNSRDYSFLVSYMTVTERNRNPLQIVFSADVRKMHQQIRLELEREDSDRTLLRAINVSERDFSAEDRRELLERVASLLR
ncbi:MULTISPECIES: lipoprotein, NlpB [Halomonas]|uniref:Lipoprotein, NlpB n=2 Tax=Halomonas TaxID=2745 RepID=A0A7X4W0M5_9GAMM|nr:MULTISPECIES: lipoprotein, NlpB [Halomonas]MDR5900801.1 lipoprotein, NlpB [Halomonas icarae]NAW13731.1 lipoprotein, NlpB [Halomonas icarae]TDB00418.1 lipoprotein, NlpB [Halomonas marinisediminis]